MMLIVKFFYNVSKKTCTLNILWPLKNPYKLSEIKPLVKSTYEEKWRFAKVLKPLYPMRVQIRNSNA
jgi:hypothetical protein